MKTFILLTRLIREEVHPTFALEEKEKEVKHKIRDYLPDVKWQSCYAVMGPWDYLDIFEAENEDEALKVSALVRYYGGAHTELWPVKSWDDFKQIVCDLAEVMEK